MVDAVRCFHPETSLYSWRAKSFNKKGRIDHLLVTPKLMPFITEARYVFHEHVLKDRASLLFTLNIKKPEKGPGIFSANPSLLNHPNYKKFINNVIRFTVIDAIKDKESLLYCQIMDNFNKKIAIQEEIVSLKII